MTSESTSTPRALRCAVIGAGVSGLLCAIELLRAGHRDVTVYEKAERVGGTWRDNTYPGVACDVPSPWYCYSFAPNPDFSCIYAPGAEIQSYVEDIVKRFGLASHLRLGTEVERFIFDNGRWRIELAGGQVDHADVVIAATGILHHPQLPNIPGLDRFAGRSFHSARWEHGVELEGKRLGIVGTGATAVQLVAALVDRVAQLSLFQRTPQWVMPAENTPFTPEQRAQFRADPAKHKQVRDSLMRAFAQHFANAVIDADSPELALIEAGARAHLDTVRDPVLREKLRPNYRAACKRLLISSSFYPAIQRPNAELVVDAIEAVEPRGVRTKDGKLHELDVLVLATGFRVDRFIRPAEVVGPNGLRLDDVWGTHPSAYLSLAVPEFPNFFMINGPNSPIGNFSQIEVAELQMQYILQLLEQLRSGGRRALSPDPVAAASFEEARVAATRNTVWVTGCKSWYLDDRGVPASWPWTLERFREVMAAPDLGVWV